MKLQYFRPCVTGAGVVWPSAVGAARSLTNVKMIAGKPSEFRFASKKTLPTGTVTFRMPNAGLIPHDFKICASPKGGWANTCVGKGTKPISSRKSSGPSYTFKTKGTYENVCKVSGHAAAGMKDVLKVT